MVNSGASGIIKASLEAGKKSGDPLASLVDDIKVEKGKVDLLLKDEDGGTIKVEIDLKLNPTQNAARYYENRTKLMAKETKTKAAAEIALKKAKISAASEIKQQKLAQKKKALAVSRKSMWFEKFYWFLSSENFLVISAHDAQQNEVIIKKYLSPTDIVLHAHIQGAAFTIIKG